MLLLHAVAPYPAWLLGDYTLLETLSGLAESLGLCYTGSRRHHNTRAVVTYRSAQFGNIDDRTDSRYDSEQPRAASREEAAVEADVADLSPCPWPV